MVNKSSQMQNCSSCKKFEFCPVDTSDETVVQLTKRALSILKLNKHQICCSCFIKIRDFSELVDKRYPLEKNSNNPTKNLPNKDTRKMATADKPSLSNNSVRFNDSIVINTDDFSCTEQSVVNNNNGVVKNKKAKITAVRASKTPAIIQETDPESESFDSFIIPESVPFRKTKNKPSTTVPPVGQKPISALSSNTRNEQRSDELRLEKENLRLNYSAAISNKRAAQKLADLELKNKNFIQNAKRSKITTSEQKLLSIRHDKRRENHSSCSSASAESEDANEGEKSPENTRITTMSQDELNDFKKKYFGVIQLGDSSESEDECDGNQNPVAYTVVKTENFEFNDRSLEFTDSMASSDSRNVRFSKLRLNRAQPSRFMNTDSFFDD